MKSRLKTAIGAAALALLAPMIPVASSSVEAADTCHRIHLNNDIDLKMKDGRYLNNVQKLTGQFWFCAPEGDILNPHKYEISSRSYVGSVDRPTVQPLSPSFAMWWNVGQPNTSRALRDRVQTFRLDQHMRIPDQAGIRRSSQLEFNYAVFVTREQTGPVYETRSGLRSSGNYFLCIQLQYANVLQTDNSIRGIHMDGESEKCTLIATETVWP